MIVILHYIWERKDHESNSAMFIFVIWYAWLSWDLTTYSSCLIVRSISVVFLVAPKYEYLLLVVFDRCSTNRRRKLINAVQYCKL